MTESRCYRSTILIVNIFIFVSYNSPSIADTGLTRYELLHSSSLRHTIIPNHLSSVPNGNSRQIHFYSLGRSFGIHLTRHRHLFTPGFTALTVNGKGESKPVHVDTEKFHIGHLIGDKNSIAVAHISDTGLLTAHIKTHNDSYYIEPASLHLKGSHDNHMIVYKLSDNVAASTDASLPLHKMDYVTVPPVSSILEENKIDRKHNILKRQANDMPDTCTLAIVVDFKLYSLLQSSESTVINTLAIRISAIDRMSFRPTQWIIDANNNRRTGIGVDIGTFIIHTEFSTDPDHYNSRQSSDINIASLLRRFSRGNWDNYCLAHLVTLRRSSSGQLGLAYIASPNSDETGGICSGRVIDGGSGDVVIYNTGVSVAGTEERLLLPHEAQLVMAHEIGHSWGSPHDPGDRADCRQVYLMNEFAQDDTEPTHRQFSPCSRTSVGRVLINKATCFQTLSSSNCGNYVVDEGEECDGGRPTVDDKDVCCNSSCHLRSRAESACSDINHFCCQNCTVSPAGSKICHSVGNVSNDCTVATSCNGIDYNCPPALPAAEGAPCLQGVCKYQNDSNITTQCVSLCAIEGYEHCRCTGSHRCVECCLNVNGNGTCQPLLNDKEEQINFPDGVFCDTGVCLKGVCVDQTQDFASFLWEVISTLNINEFNIFLQANIVTFVLIFSLLVWVPVSCAMYWLCDVKQLWKKFLPHSDTDEGGPAFVTQSSWVQVKTELNPLLSHDDVISSDLFQPVEEPEDDLPLPLGYRDNF